MQWNRNLRMNSIERINKAFTSVFWFPSILLLVFWVVVSANYPTHDYANSYFPSYFLLKGDFSDWIFDPYTFNKKIFEEGFKNVYGNFNPNPPTVAIFFIPFALIPLGLSKLIFNIISIALFLISAIRICKHVHINAIPVFIWMPLIFFVPFRNQVLFGQSYFLLFFLLIEGFIAYRRRKYFLFSSFWSIAIFLKVFPVIIFLFLLLQRDWKAMVSLALGCLTTFFLSIAVIDFAIWKFYFQHILPRSNNGEISSAYTTSYQSAHMLFKFLFIKDQTLNTNVWLDSTIMFNTAIILFKAVILTLCISIIKMRRDILSFGVLMLCGILLSPYGSTYSNILLLLILVGIYQTHPPRIIIFSILILAACNVPIGVIKDLPIALQFPRLFIMVGLVIYCFFILKLSITKQTVWIYLFSMTIVSLPILLNQNNKISDHDYHMLSNEDHLLIYDFGVIKNKLFYNYWDSDGSHIVKTDFTVHSMDRNVNITNNQIFFNGRQLTHSNDNKSKAILVNDNIVVYLSDKGKGFGFFTLRAIPIDNEYL